MNVVNQQRGWLVSGTFLVSAIILEVVGTSLLTYFSRNGEWLGYLIMGVTITLSYYLLSQAVKRIPVGIAYAIWEGFGLLLLAAIGAFVFGEEFSTQKVAGMLLATVGIICVTLGGKRVKKRNKA